MKMDADYDLPGLAILFVLAALIVGLRIPSIVAINTAGHFKQVKRYAVIEAIINITLSVILTLKFNIYGVLIATIIAGMYRTPVLIHYAYKHIYNQSIAPFFKKLLLGGAFFALSYLVSTYVYYTPSSLFSWFLDAFIVFVLVVVAVLIMLFIFNRPLVTYLMGMVKRKDK